jgi:glyoxylase-like metal-dependent hydrolase (beta-lactamase superfamily II)
MRAARKTEAQTMATWVLGDTSVTRIIESEDPLLSPFEIFPDCTAEHIAANASWMTPAFYDPVSALLVISIQSYVIRTGGLTIIVDTCTGEGKNRSRVRFHQRTWPWLERLRAAGIEPESVDVVMCSHLHVDHVGWNTRLENGKWVPTFPNARYLIARKEWEYWRDQSRQAGLQRTGDYVADSVLPIFDAGQADLIDTDHGIASTLWLEPTPGHTPGHFAVHVGGGEEDLILSGDLMHHPLQLRYPQWSTRFCTDPALARETRAAFLAKYAGTRTVIAPAHFPNPGGIFIERAGDHYGFVNAPHS